MNENLEVVANYSYNAWGLLLSVTDANGNAVTGVNHPGNMNPIRYRGYYYDTETGFYYCGSRYYDPESCRFISLDNTDVLTASPMAMTDKNLYAYCDNNPVMRVDHGGQFWKTLKAYGQEILKQTIAVAGIALATALVIGAGAGTIMSGGIGAAALPAVMTLAATLVQASAAVAIAGVAVGGGALAVGTIGENISYSISNSNSNSNRKFNISKQNSDIFNSFKRVKGEKYRTSGSGKNKRFYECDYTHNDIEVYDKLGKHLGSMDPITGEMYKGAVKGRTLW